MATALKAGGYWNDIHRFHILHAGDTLLGRRNLVNPTDTHRTTISGTLLFSEGNGSKSNGTSYINQPFKSDEYVGIESDLIVIQYISESSATAATIASHGYMVNSSGALMVTYPLQARSEEHTSELQSLMRISYA